ncbi:CAP domain-containing protein [Weizmannia sp. CD-2023]|uniref:CAP domain-containing protein n=1 Tax=Weizmannia sp. CD-2023 TaxID=3037263 RepID=UPI002E1B8D7B|nr:CAP domain-containing protein [Weizmannia sp. CD-2023]
MKKAMFTTAAALALILAPAVSGKAGAASNETNCSPKTVVQHEYKFHSMQELENWLKQHNIRFSFKPATNQTASNNAGKTDQTTAAPKQSAPEQTAAPKQSASKQTSTQPAGSTQSQAANTLNAYEKQVVTLVNEERAKNGLGALKIDTALSKMARVKSNDMATHQYFDHTSPTYGSPFDMMKQFGISYQYAGENIAMGQQTPQEVMNAWMNSEGHRANILNKNFTHIGVGYVENGHYWTQEFIGK